MPPLLIPPDMTPFQISILVVAFVATLIPSTFILRRLGFSAWWAIIAPITPLNIIGLWILAFTTWPVARRNSNFGR